MNLGVAQLVARYLGVVEAAGSSPVTQTRNRKMINLPIFLYFTRVFRTFRVRIFCFKNPLKKEEKTRKIGLVQNLVQDFKKELRPELNQKWKFLKIFNRQRVLT